MTRRMKMAMAGTLFLGLGCNYSPTYGGGSGSSGELTLRLTTPHPDDGAVLFEVVGAPVESSVAANGALRLFTRRDGNNRLVGALIGDVNAGAVVRLRVPDAGAAAGYQARVLEVADRHNLLRQSLAGYGMMVAP